MNPTRRDYDLKQCSWCKRGTLDVDPALLVPGYDCPGLGCNAYLIVLATGRKAGSLVWHTPDECEEYDEPCKFCAIYNPLE